MKNKKLLINLGIIGCLTIGISPALLLTSCSKNKTTTDDENQNKPNTNPGGSADTTEPTIDFTLENSYDVGSISIITAICSNIDNSKNYDVQWSISNPNIVELVDKPGFDVSLKAKQAGSFELTAKLLENDTIITSKTKTIVFKETTSNLKYNVTIITNNQSRISVGNNQIFSVNLTSSDGSEISNNFYYQWTCDCNEVINNNGQNSINITWQNSGLHTLKLNVYDSINQTNLVASTTYQQYVFDENSLRYGLTIDGVDPITSRKFSNQAVDFDTVINNAQNSLNQNLNQFKVNEYFNQIISKYINTFKGQRNNLVTHKILNNKITLNSDKTISGTIEIEFTITGDINSSAPTATCKNGDKEIHTFVFENNKIEAYVNKTITNFLSFKIIPKYIKKQYIKIDSSQNRTIGVKDSPLYFDSINELTLQLNNSLFAIDTTKLFDNMYLYNAHSTTNEQKLLIKEVITSLLTEKAKLICSSNDNPLRPGVAFTTPILEISLTKNYNISTDFATNLMWTLGSLFNFIPTKSGIVKISNNKIYFATATPMLSSLNFPNKFVDLSSGNEQTLTTPYVEMPANDIFNIELQIKEKLISNNKSKISSNWLDYVNNLTQRQKAEKIYDFILPFVSYGGMVNKGFPSSIGGYLDQKIICEGYANLFSYVANILGISSITITGKVKENADSTGAGGGHAWNLINVDNNWLWCDPTWDDGMSAGSDVYQKTNFLIDSEHFFTTDTHLSVTNWNAGADLPIPVPKPTVKLAMPTDAELLITGKPLKYSGNIKTVVHLLNIQEAKNKINEYGVLNTFALITKIYANSDMFFNATDFDNITVELIENQNYDKLKFKISGLAKRNLTKWGRFPFATLKEGWPGANINTGDNVQVIFTYNRWSGSNIKGQNKFDDSNITFGKSLSDGFKWLGIDTGGMKLNLPYTTDFVGGCEIIINNQTIRSTYGDNRVFFAFIYNFKDEYKPTYNDNNILCDNTCINK